MQSYRVELLPAAWEDLQGIVDYISMENPQAAEKMFEGIMKSLKRLEDFPNSGVCPPDQELEKMGYRMVISPPYISFYRVIGAIVYVYHIVHGAREYAQLFENIIQS